MILEALPTACIPAESSEFRTYSTGVQYLIGKHPLNQGETQFSFHDFMLRLVGAYLVKQLPTMINTQLELLLQVIQHELAHWDLPPLQLRSEHYIRLWKQLENGENLTSSEYRLVARVLLKTVQHQSVVARLMQLGEELTAKCYEHAEQVTQLCVKEDITGTGTHAAARAATYIGDRSNLGQSYFLTLVETGKGYIRQLHKLVDLEQFFSDHPSAWVSFLLFGRSHFAKKRLANKWQISEQGALAWMTSVRRALERTCALPPSYRALVSKCSPTTTTNASVSLALYFPITAQEFRLACESQINVVIQRLAKFPKESRAYQNTKTFLSKLKRMADPMISQQVVDHLFVAPLQVPLRLGRKDLYQKCIKLRSVIKGRAKKYYSAVEAVLTCAALLFPQVVAVPIHSLSPAMLLTPANSLTRPFARRRIQLQAYQAKEAVENPLVIHAQPIHLIMKHDQVIIRAGNNNHLTTKMLQNGYLDMWFPACEITRLKGVLFRKKPSSRPRTTETIRKRLLIRVVATPKMKHILKMGATINQLVILPPKGPKRKITVNIIFSGPKQVFISWKYLSPEALERYNRRTCYTFPPTNEIAFDFNRISTNIVASSTKAPISTPLYQTCMNYHKTTTERKQLHQSLSRAQQQRDIAKIKRIKRSLSLLERRRSALRQATHELTTLETGSQMALSQVTTVISEILDLDPRNTRGGLARAIYNMPDEIDVLIRAVRAVRGCYPTRDIKLYMLPPVGTSLRHVGCMTTPPGRLKRNPGQYDRAPCNTCNVIKNTHINAAEELIIRFKDDTSAYIPTQL